MSLYPYIKSYYRSALPHEHLQSILMMNTTSEHQLSTILSQKTSCFSLIPPKTWLCITIFYNTCILITNKFVQVLFLGLVYIFDFIMSSWPPKPEYLLSSLSPKRFADPCSSLISSHSTNAGIICSNVFTSAKVNKTLERANLSPKLLDLNTNTLNWMINEH